MGWPRASTFVQKWMHPEHPVGSHSGNHLSAGLEKCFGQMIEIVNGHLNQFTIKDILEIEEPNDFLAFEI